MQFPFVSPVGYAGSVTHIMLHDLAVALEAALPHMSWDIDGCMVSSLRPCWFLSPLQHVWEFVLVNAVLLPLLAYWTLKHPWRVVVPAATPAERLSAAGKPGSRMDSALAALEVLGAATGVCTLVATVVFKILSHKLMYLLQPCHVLNLALVYLAFSRRSEQKDNPGKVNVPSVVFNVYLHSCYGAWLALLQPGTSTCPDVSLVRGRPAAAPPAHVCRFRHVYRGCVVVCRSRNGR